MTAARLIAASLPAWIVTLGLFALMQGLVTVEATVDEEIADITGIDWVKVWVPKKEIPPPRIIRPTRLATSPPPVLPPPTSGRGDEGEGTLALVKRIDPLPRNPIAGSELAIAADGSAVPLVQIPPQYPARAMQQRREGRVLVGFTITKAGGVRDARVLAAEPAGVFEESALKAISQWRYGPKVENGIAVEQRDQKTTITFRLDPARS